MGAEPGQSISLVVQLTAPPPGVVPTNQPQPSVVPRSDDYHMPDMFTVEVGGERGHTKEVLVKVERTAVKKPFLGGYRHRVTGVEYHHASVQTMPKKRLDTGVRDAHMYVRGIKDLDKGVLNPANKCWAVRWANFCMYYFLSLQNMFTDVLETDFLP